jgi:hypothetical protein
VKVHNFFKFAGLHLVDCTVVFVRTKHKNILLLTIKKKKMEITTLKVPKREIFNRLDFPDFYTIKSLRVGDFGVKIKKVYKIFTASFRGAKFLMRMLSLFLRRLFF